MNPFQRFFRTEEEESSPDREAVAAWQEALEFSRLAYYKRLLLWLENEAMRPIRIDEGRDMVVSAARQNALLEVRQHILSDIRAAEQGMRSYGS